MKKFLTLICVILLSAVLVQGRPIIEQQSNNDLLLTMMKSAATNHHQHQHHQCIKPKELNSELVKCMKSTEAQRREIEWKSTTSLTDVESQLVVIVSSGFNNATTFQLKVKSHNQTTATDQPCVWEYETIKNDSFYPNYISEAKLVAINHISNNDIGRCEPIYAYKATMKMLNKATNGVCLYECKLRKYIIDFEYVAGN